MQELASNDYKTILREELASRCRQNPRYSLRAFARDLKLAPSRLSEVLSGKQGLSRAAADKIARSLGYGAGEIERFCDLVESLHARSKRDRDSARVRLKKHAVPSATYQVQIDVFRVIADWYHFGILELTRFDDFKSDSKWIAKRLGISEFETQLSLERLTRLGLIVTKGGKIKPTEEHGLVPDDIPSESVKKFHGQILAKATEALQFQAQSEREFGSEIIAIDRAQLGEAKKMLRDFRSRFCKKMDESEVKDGLYCLALQFFDLGDKG